MIANSLQGTVKEMSALPSSPTFCTIMSTVTFRSAIREKISKLVARLVGHVRDRDACLVLGHGRTADGAFDRLRLDDDHRPGCVAEAAADVDRHVNFLANSIDRLCITPAPRLASSSISS